MSNFISLRNFRQTTDYTCGPACMKMIYKLYGEDVDEMELASSVGTSPIYGTNVRQIKKYLRSTKKFYVECSIDANKNKSKFQRLEHIEETVSSGVPVMVEWITWGGHWSVVVGSTENNLIISDPYDGEYQIDKEKFLSMWFDRKLLPPSERENAWLWFKPFWSSAS